MTSDIDSIVHWKEEGTFEIDITLPLRKVGIESITGDKYSLRFWFMNDTGLSIDYPENLVNLVKTIEKALLRFDGYYEGHGLKSYVIKRITNYLKENINEITKAIEKARK